MTDFMYSMLVGLLFAGGSVGIVIASYLAARRLLHPGAEGDRTHDVAVAIGTRIVTLHGLILALVYAQELGDYKDVRGMVTDEATAVADVFNDARRYGGDAVTEIQRGLARYLDVVVRVEWDMLGHRQGLSPDAWRAWDGVNERILDLTPTSERERALASRMRDRMAAIAKARSMRGATASSGFSSIFWAPALIGLALVVVPFYVYRPTRSHLALLSVFGVYSGVILFFIYAFSNPFAPPGKLEPEPLAYLLSRDLGAVLKPK